MIYPREPRDPIVIEGLRAEIAAAKAELAAAKAEIAELNKALENHEVSAAIYKANIDGCKMLIANARNKALDEAKAIVEPYQYSNYPSQANDAYTIVLAIEELKEKA